MDEFTILFYLALAVIAALLLWRWLRGSSPERAAQAAGELTARAQHKAASVAEAFKQGRNKP